MGQCAEKISATETGEEISPLSIAVIKALLYFDIFQYPVTVEEVFEYCVGQAATKETICKELNKLQSIGYVSRIDSFYQIQNENMQGLVDRRIKGNAKAQKFLKIARPFTKFIAHFPFVRGICLSGSLSKGYADKDSDIDYFIITEPGRLWISRTMLVLFKKLFLFNSHKYFCVNYFIDTNSLEIPDRNLFVATELLSIIPAYNTDLYEKLMHTNSWVKRFYPNGSIKTSKYNVLPVKRGILQRFGEFMFSGRIGNWADNVCFKATLSAWKRKFKHFNADEFDLKLRTRKNVSKHHPNGFQNVVMDAFDEKVKGFEQRFNVSLV